MPPPSPPVETELAQFLPALPADWDARMRERGALTSAGNIPTPEALLRALLLSGGPDHSLREVAGTLTRRAERSTAQAVGKRLHRCPPFLIARLKPLLPLAELPALPAHLRFLACEGTPLACPGAPGTDDRLHLVMHWWTLSLQEGPSSETKQGERLQHSRLHTGEVMVAERGDGSYAGLRDRVCARGAAVLVRWHPPLPL
jgi:hypothetical protein